MIRPAKDDSGIADLSFAEKERRRVSTWRRAQNRKANDVGVIPPCKNPDRRRLCRTDLHLFLQWYLPHSCGLAPYGEDQVGAIERIQRAAFRTARVLNVLPRGFTKSSIGEGALLWLGLYGWRKYLLFFSATGTEAADVMDSVQMEIEENPRIADDFPEVVHPIRALEGRTIRTHTQTYQDEPTHITWKAGVCALPVIPGSDASGCVIRAKGFESAVRGTRWKLPSGKSVRPDALFFDDVSTDDQAENPNRVNKQIKSIAKLFRLGGHGYQPMGVMNATIIAEDDVPDQMSDHKKHPEWQAVNAPMLKKMPDNVESFWLNQYKRVRDNYNPDIVGDQERARDEATALYVEKREEADAGAVPSWLHIPLEPGEISATQHAMNIYCDDGPDIFASECQNQPRRAVAAGVARIEAAFVKERKSGLARLTLPEKTAFVVAHCDVHDAILYYTVAAIQSDYTASIVDIGCDPEQRASSWSMHSIKRTLMGVSKAENVEQAIAEGVKRVANELGSRVWATPEGQTFPMAAMLFDVGYKPEEVTKGIRLSNHASICYGARGVGLGPADKPMTEYDTSPKRVRRSGPLPKRPRWYIPRTTLDGIPVVRFDANWWKSFASSRLVQPETKPGAWTLFGNHATDHSFFVEHLCAEEPIQVTAKGRTVLVWKERPNHENHWWDTLVGCCVAGSLVGIQPPGIMSPARIRKKRRRRGPAVEVLDI